MQIGWKRENFLSDDISKLLKGTTTVGIKVREGIVIASDKRATANTFVASKRAVKTIKIADYAVATISGLVADGQFLVQNVRAISEIYEMESGRRMPIEGIAKYLTLLLRSYRPYFLLAHMIVGGIDYKGSHLFNVDFFGTMTEENYLATGSGSPVAISVIEQGYREDMPLDEGKLLVISAMVAALSRDAATGDGIDLTVVSKEGVHFATKEEVQEIIDKVGRRW